MDGFHDWIFYSFRNGYLALPCPVTITKACGAQRGKQACIICGIAASWIPGTFFPPGTFIRFTRFLHDFTRFLCDFYAIFCQAQNVFSQAPKTIMQAWGQSWFQFIEIRKAISQFWPINICLPNKSVDLRAFLPRPAPWIFPLHRPTLPRASLLFTMCSLWDIPWHFGKKIKGPWEVFNWF